MVLSRKSPNFRDFALTPYLLQEAFLGMACSVKLFTAYRQLFITNNNDLLKEIIDKCRQKNLIFTRLHLLIFLWWPLCFNLCPFCRKFSQQGSCPKDKELIKGAEEFLNSLQENYIFVFVWISLLPTESSLDTVSKLQAASATRFFPWINKEII